MMMRSLSRREFLLAAGATAAGGVLAACGSTTTATRSPAPTKVKPGTLSVFISKDTAHPQGQAAAMNALLQLFESKFPGSSFTYDTYASASEELEKLETSAAAHQGPDIFEFGSTLIPTAYATGAFEVFTDQMWAELGGKGAFFTPQLKMSGPSPDKLIAVPKTANPFAMFYNKAMFEEAGITKPPTTWTEFVDIAKELTKPDQGQWGAIMDPADGFDPWHLVWLFSTQLGGHLLAPDLKSATLDSPQVVEAAAFWLDWMARFKIASPQDATYKGADMIKAFANRQAAMLVLEGPAGIITFDASPIAGEYAVASDPTVPYGMHTMPKGGKPATGFVSGQYWTIFKYSPNKELALELIKLMTSPEIQYQFFKQEAQTPVTLAAFEKYPETKRGVWAEFYTAEEDSYPTPFSGAWGQLEVVVGQAINKIAGEIATTGTYSMSDLRAALAQANQQLNAAMSQ
jgi:multiple sugar transport system substrate-binding protein